MKRKTLLIIIFLFILLVILILLIRHWTREQNQACFKNYCFDLELAKTPEERSRGLMFRESLDLDKGMLFVFEKEGAYSFWMKNTLIPLDIIWINKDKEIVFISENTQPCKEEYICPSVNPEKNAKYVLEVNGGMAEKIGLKIGDKTSLGKN